MTMSRTFVPRFKLLLLCAVLAPELVFATKTIDSNDIPQAVIQNTFEHLNNLAPTQRYIKSANFVSGYVLRKQPEVIYRLTVDLELNCDGNVETCPHEICVIDVQQRLDYVTIEPSSIQCTLLKTTQDTYNSKNVSKLQESMPDGLQAQAVIEELGKQIVNTQTQFIEEPQREADMLEKSFVAVKASSQYCPGCPYELKPNLPGLWALGEEAVSSMDQYSTSDFKYKILEIIQVFRSVPPNLNAVRYEILIKIGNSTCLKTSLIDRSECSVQPNTPLKLCLVTIDEKPWLEQNKRKVIKNNCTDSTNTLNELNVNNFEESSSTQEDDMQSYIKPEMYEYDQVAQEGKLTQAVSENESNSPIIQQSSMNVISNVKPEQDPVPQFMDKYKEFDEFLKDFDVPIRETSTTPDSRMPVEEELVKRLPYYMEQAVRTKRQLSPEKIFLRKLAQIVVDILDGIDEDNDKRLVLDVLDAKKETEDESVYHLTVQVINTKCTEKEALDRKCMADLVGPTNICKMEVEVNRIRPLGPPKIRNSTCVEEEQVKPLRKKREQSVDGNSQPDTNDTKSPKLVGGKRPIDINDPQVQRYAALGVSKYTELYEGTDQPVLIEITDAKVQVVAGMLYEIMIKIGKSNCTKGEQENCHPKEDPNTKSCLVKIWSRPWLDHGDVETTVNCDTNSRKKRHLRGQNYSLKMQQAADLWRDQERFKDFKEKYGKSYSSKDEEKTRFQIFRDNLSKIRELQRTEQGTGRYDITQFTDLTIDEFRKFYTGLKLKEHEENSLPLAQAEIPDISIPTNFDWRHYNVVTPVKDQGTCGSCWAFSVTGNIESLYAIKHGQLLSLSEQELVDCDRFDEGCNGGLPSTAYEAIERLGGLETEDEYPYDGRDEKCHFNKKMVKVEITSGLNITHNETQMAQWLVKNGPITIGINANAMMFYVGGISHPFKFLCNPKNLDHGVLIVGYGVKKYPIFNKVLPYWIIKNSWGHSWGEQGYYRVYRGDGTCGVNQMPTSAIVA